MKGAPIKWYGGKFYLLKYLLSLIPAHDVYVEVFGGAGHLLFAKPPSKIEIYNDLHSGVVSLYRVLKDKNKLKEFYDRFCYVLYSRELHKEFSDSWKHCDDDVDRAVSWLCSSWSSINGIAGAGFSTSVKKPRVPFRRFINKIDSIFARLRNVVVEQLDFKDLILKYDGDNVFFYVDPPYLPETRASKKVYEHELPVERHKELIQILLNVKGKVLLSGYDNQLYKVLEDNGWNKEFFKHKAYAYVMCKQTNASKRSDRVEVVWYNYDKKIIKPNLLLIGK
jgi:DNA adenine methylase